MHFHEELEVPVELVHVKVNFERYEESNPVGRYDAGRSARLSGHVPCSA